MQKSKTQSQKIRDMVSMAMFCALAYAVVLVCKPIPEVAGFLSWDMKDSLLIIAGFIYGPVAALTMSVTVSFIEMITISATGFYGFLMNAVASGAISGAAALVYQKHRSLRVAYLALGLGVLSMTVLMVAFNLFVTPLYMGVTVAQVKAMIPTILLPFNLAKGLLNAALALFLYKPVTRALRYAKVLPPERRTAVDPSSDEADKQSRYFDAVTIFVMISAVLLAAGAIIWLFSLG